MSSSDVNEYLHRHVGPRTTAKDFRTWGSALVVGVLGPLDATADPEAERRILEAVDVAAEQLRNTRAVCRQSYVHPAVLDAFRDGTLHDHWATSRSSRRLDRADRTLLKTLEDL